MDGPFGEKKECGWLYWVVRVAAPNNCWTFVVHRQWALASARTCSAALVTHLH
jgi:hypothetical protein